MPKTRQDSTLDDLYRRLHLGLILRTARTRRQYHHAIMLRPLLITWIQLRIVTAGFAHGLSEIVANHDLVAATKEIDHPGMACQLVERRLPPNLPRQKCSWMRQARRKTPALDAPCRIANRAPQRCNHSNQQSICGRPDEFGALSVSVGLSSSYSGHRTAGNCSCVRDVAHRILPTAAASLSLYASVLDKFYSSLEAATHPVHLRTTPGTKAGSAPHRPSPLAVVNSTASVWLFPTVSESHLR